RTGTWPSAGMPTRALSAAIAKISFAGKAAVHLDKIGALVLLVVADGFCLIGSFNLNRLRAHRWVAINDGTRKIKVRSKDGFRGEFAPKFVCVGRTEHISHSGHSVRDIKRIGGFVVPRVDVHVPEAEDQVLAVSMYRFGISWEGCVAAV